MAIGFFYASLVCLPRVTTAERGRQVWRYCGCGIGLLVGVGVVVCEIGVGFSVETGGERRVAVVGVCEIGVGFSGAAAGAGADVCDVGVDRGVVVGTCVCDTGAGPECTIEVCETGVISECTDGVCEAGCIPPAWFFASPGGMQPADPTEQPHPVLLP